MVPGNFISHENPDIINAVAKVIYGDINIPRSGCHPHAVEYLPGIHILYLHADHAFNAGRARVLEMQHGANGHGVNGPTFFAVAADDSYGQCGFIGSASAKYFKAVIILCFGRTLIGEF